MGRIQHYFGTKDALVLAGCSPGDDAALTQARRLLALADGLTLRVLVRDLEPAEAVSMLEAEVGRAPTA